MPRLVRSRKTRVSRPLCHCQGFPWQSLVKLLVPLLSAAVARWVSR